MGIKERSPILLTEFVSLKKNNGKSILEFNKRFKNISNVIPTNIRPSPIIAKVKSYL